MATLSAQPNTLHALLTKDGQLLKVGDFQGVGDYATVSEMLKKHVAETKDCTAKMVRWTGESAKPAPKTRKPRKAARPAAESKAEAASQAALEVISVHFPTEAVQKAIQVLLAAGRYVEVKTQSGTAKVWKGYNVLGQALAGEALTPGQIAWLIQESGQGQAGGPADDRAGVRSSWASRRRRCGSWQKSLVRWQRKPPA